MTAPASARGPGDAAAPASEAPAAERPDGAADGLFQGRAAWAGALRRGFADAMARDARRIVCVDRDFGDWPLSDAALLDALGAWLRRPQRRWVLLAPAAGFDALPRRHPRFERWRAPWAHAIDCFAPPGDEALDWPALLLDDGDRVVRLLDRERARGLARADAAEARRWSDGVNELLQRCDAAHPVTRLGL